LDMADTNTILTTRTAELETVDHAVVGVAHAVGDLRKALDALEGLLGERQFEKAAASGYQEIASAFIFLQRTLGGLQSAEANRLPSSQASRKSCNAPTRTRNLLSWRASNA